MRWNYICIYVVVYFLKNKMYLIIYVVDKFIICMCFDNVFMYYMFIVYF